tara:strand:- start:1942 stop:2973 length:1032 start_codon:yes stop_codon:yes gene_type:complete
MKKNIIAFLTISTLIFTGCVQGVNKSNNSLLPTDSDIKLQKQGVNAITQSMPSVMVFPSDGMLKRLGYLKEKKNQGVVGYDRQYQQALIDDQSLKFAIAVIEEEFAKVGFPLDNLEQTLKQIVVSSAVDEMANVSKDVRAELLNTARPDYVIELDYNLITDLKSRNLNRSLTYSVRALDVYSNKTIASISKTNVGKEQKTDNDAATLIKEAFPNNFQDFRSQITQHYADLLANGVEITLRLATKNSSGISIDDYCGDKEVGESVVEWMKDNTVNQTYKMSKNTSSEIFFTNVRIYSQDEKGQKFTAYDFANSLKNEIKSGCSLDVSNKTQSIGDALIIIKGTR